MYFSTFSLVSELTFLCLLFLPVLFLLLLLGFRIIDYTVHSYDTILSLADTTALLAVGGHVHLVPPLTETSLFPGLAVSMLVAT